MNDEKALKSKINKTTVTRMAKLFQDIYPSFKSTRFLKKLSVLEGLELKDRVRLIASALKDELPKDFNSTAPLIKKVLETKLLIGFELWPISEFISNYGLDHFDESFELMYLLTQDFTSEFAIRAFLNRDLKRSFKILQKWVDDENVHVRRLVSEGTRPILPWGGKILSFIEQPITIKLIEKLRYDDEIYVRKSVANHLNDISKFHPELLIETLKRWEAEAPKSQKDNIKWIKKHSLRTLIKKGHPGALGLMGASKRISCKVTDIKLNKKSFHIGDDLIFYFSLKSLSRSEQKLVIDYGINFCKSGGKKSIKIFKLKMLKLHPGESVHLTKKHSLKKITTMKYYSGEHELILKINGASHQKITWSFKC